MSNESRFTKRYTTQQKDAILKAVCIDQASVAQAIRSAANGKLDVPAFTINRQYAYQVVKDGRESFEARNPEALRLAIDTELTALAARALAQARTLAKSETATPDDLRRTVAALKAAQSGLAKPQAPEKADGKPNADDGPQDQGPDVLGSLIGRAPKPKPAPQGADPGSLTRAQTG